MRWILMFVIFIVPLAVYPTYLAYATPKWTIIYAVISILSMGALFKIEKFRIPVLNSRVWSLILLSGLFYGCSMVLNSPGHYMLPMAHWTGVVLLVLFSYNYLTLDYISKAINYVTVPVLVLAYVQHLNVIPIGTWFRPTHDIVSTLGNKNYLAVFLGFSALLQIYSWRVRENKKQLILLALTLYIMSVAGCRSAVLALICGVSFVSLKWFTFKAKAIILVPVIILLTIGAYNMRKHSADTRIIMWKNSVAIVKEKPLFGFGPNKFVSAYGGHKNSVIHDPVLNEVNLESHPHNSYIETMVENGLLFFITIMTLIIILFIQIHNCKGCRKERALLLSVFIFLSVEAFFAFSLSLPSIYLLTSLMLGQSLKFIRLKSFMLAKDSKCIFFLYVLGFAIISFQRWNSHHAFYKTPLSLKKITEACEFWPSSWVICMRKGELEILFHKYSLAENTFKDILDNYPKLYVAVGQLARSYALQNKRERACYYYNEYKNLLRRDSFLDESFKKYCEE